MYGCAEQKLSDICMVGSRRHEFVITEKEDTLPQRTPDIPVSRTHVPVFQLDFEILRTIASFIKFL